MYNIPMKKPPRLLCDDTVAVVSLSSGILGETFAKHQLDIAEQRLRDIFGLNVRYMNNALRGIDYLTTHPEARADDLKQAMLDDDVKAIIVATGGTDTFKTVPYLMDDKDFVHAIKTKPKIFLGFSDTTNNHLMFYRLGMATFYGIDFLSDLGELDSNMLPYTKQCIFDIFFDTGRVEIKSSPEWYRKRTSYSKEQIGVSRSKVHEDTGFEVLLGSQTATKIVQGKLFGGCIESLYEMISGERYKEQPAITKKYGLLLPQSGWGNKILFLESSEAQSTPDRLEYMLDCLGRHIDYSELKGVVVGKPQDNVYYEEYKHIWQEFAIRHDTPVLYNVNFGHAYPHCILPYDATVELSLATKQLFIISPLFSD